MKAIQIAHSLFLSLLSISSRLRLIEECLTCLLVPNFRTRRNFPWKMLSRRAVFHCFLSSVQVLSFPGQWHGFFHQHSHECSAFLLLSFVLQNCPFRLFWSKDFKVTEVLYERGSSKWSIFLPFPPFPPVSLREQVHQSDFRVQVPAQQSWQNTFWKPKFTSSVLFTTWITGGEKKSFTYWWPRDRKAALLGGCFPEPLSQAHRSCNLNYVFPETLLT